MERNDTGGGSTFLSNFSKAMGMVGHTCVPQGSPYDLLFIAGASLCERETVRQAVAENKPIILRVDNLLEDRRNRNGGMPKMLEYAQLADAVIYQSDWARNFLKPVIGKNGPVIHNGVDTDIFFPRKETLQKPDNEERIFIYAKYSRGEGKQFHVVQQYWREHHLVRPQDKLLLAGRFAEEFLKASHPFEFHNGERYEYLGVLGKQEMAKAMRHADVAILPYFSDACSNTILEAKASGLSVVYDMSGGTPELVSENDFPILFPPRSEIGRKGIALDEGFVERFGLLTMARKYGAVFDFALAPPVEF